MLAAGLARPALAQCLSAGKHLALDGFTGAPQMIFGIKLYWSPIDAVIAAFIASVGVYLIYLAHPWAHPFVFGTAWVLGFCLLYQTGSELTARRKSKR